MNLLSQFQIRPSTIQQVENFLSQYVKDGKVADELIPQLQEEYSHFYPFYYFCQNKIDEEQMKRYQILMKGGVN